MRVSCQPFPQAGGGAGMGLVELPGRRASAASAASERVGVVGVAHLRRRRAARALGSWSSTLRTLCSWQR